MELTKKNQEGRFRLYKLRAVLFISIVVLISMQSQGTALLLGAICLLVVLHEGGHLLAARLVGMHTSEFYCGFGPEIVSYRVGHVRYGVKMFPLGGFVSISGMGGKDKVIDYQGNEVPEEQLYRSAALWRKIVAVAAGPLANFAVAVVLIFIAIAAIGIPSSSGNQRVPVLEAARTAPVLTYEVTIATVRRVGKCS